MKKILLMAITLCISCIVFAQEGGVQIQMVERIPMGDGTWIYRYALGDKKHLEGECRLAVNEREYIVASFKNGLPEGKWETFRYDKLYERRNYKNGKLDGNVTTYSSDGKTVRKESNLSSGKRDGRYTSYYTNGQLEKEQEFKEGKEHGYLRTYDLEGNIKWDCYYEEGKMEGQQTQLISSNQGNYVKMSNYKKGALVGDYSEYYEKGGLKEKGQYDENSKKTGMWVRRLKLGRRIDETEYINGERNGKRMTFFDDDSGPDKIEIYKDDKLNGVTIEYSHKTKKLEKETTYVDGRREGPFKIYHVDGKTLESDGIYTGGNETYKKTYYPNGKLKLVQEGKGFDYKVTEQYDETGKRTK